MYYKGGNMLHTIRQVVNDDDKWRSILQGLNKDFWHQTVTTKQVESYISQKAGIDLSKVFDQYLRTTKIPLLQYRIDGNKLSFKYDRVVEGFAMPIRVIVNGVETVITPTDKLNAQAFPSEIKSVEVNRNYYVDSEVMK
jgi:aminopeptidase N